MIVIEMIKSEKLVFEYMTSDDNEKTKKVTALNNIDIKINKGEFVAVLGHNGSGKSTLAKHMNALLLPTNGTMWVKGRDTSAADNIWNVRRSAGMVFQNPDNQIVATIVEEDVAFGPENLGVESSEIRKRVDEALKTVDMSEYSGSAPYRLSGGQKQRIAIAGALAMKPDCIVLDEPTAMLDPIGRRDIIDTITRLNREDGITIILITHYMEEAVMADRVIVMEGGKIAMDGTPKEVFRNVKELKKLGLAAPQVTELCYSLRKSGVEIPDNIISIDEMVEILCQYKLRG